MKNLQITLAARPKGMLKKSDFSAVNSDLDTNLQEGEVLVKIQYISLDPAMRGWMNAGTTYIKGVEIGAPMRAFAAGEVLDSKSDQFQKGDHVTGLLGAQELVKVSEKHLTKVDTSSAALSWHLGILGMPGMTAYFGLLERGQPKAGENVFISGAAGIVGSTVGQIAKIKGCKVVGTAGTDAKCKYLIDECGFDAAINYKTENVKAALKEHFPEGLHIYYDNVGGEILDAALANLARGARVVICGAISQYNSTSMYGPKNYMKIVTARGIMTGIIVFDFIKQYPKAVSEMTAWLNSGQLKTKEDICEGLENFPTVLMKLYTGGNFGKLLLKV